MRRRSSRRGALRVEMVVLMASGRPPRGFLEPPWPPVLDCPPVSPSLVDCVCFSYVVLVFCFHSVSNTFWFVRLLFSDGLVLASIGFNVGSNAF